MLNPMRLFVLAVLAALAVVAGAQAPSLTLGPEVVRVETLLDRLREEQKIQVNSSTEMGREVIFVQAEDVPAREFLDKLAKALSAEWRQVDGVLRLERSSRLREQLLNRRAQRYLNATRFALENQAMPEEKPFTLGEATRIINEYQELSAREDVSDAGERLARALPAERLMRRILAELPFEEIVRQPEGTTLQFGLRSSRGVRSLSAAAASAWSEFVREQAVWLEVAPSDLLDEMSYDTLREASSIDGTALDLANAQLRVSVSVESGITVSLLALNARGEIFDVGPYFTADPHELETIFEAPSSDAEVTFGELSRQLIASTSDEDFETWSPPRELLEYLSEAAVKEPLALGCQEVLTAAFAGHEKPVLILVPDDAIDILEAADDEEAQSVDDLIINITFNLREIEDEGWTLAGFPDPLRSTQGRLDRRQIERLVAAYRRTGRVPFRDWATLCAEQPGPLASGMRSTVLGLLDPMAPIGDADDEDHGIVGLLTPAQWEHLSRGGTLGWNDFTGELRNRLTPYILEYGSAAIETEDGESSVTVDAFAWFGTGPGIEATTLTATVVQKDAVSMCVEGDGGTRAFAIVFEDDIDELVWFVMITEDPSILGEYAESEELAALKMLSFASSPVWEATVVIRHPSGISYQFTVADIVSPAPLRPGPWRRLPGLWPQAIEQQVKEMRESMEEAEKAEEE